MSKIIVYGTNTCGYCGAARMLLTKKGAKFEDILVHENRALREEMQARSGRTSVPQIFIGDHHVGGYDDLAALERAGELDAMLQLDDK